MKLKLLILFYLVKYTFRATFRSREQLLRWQERRITRFVRRIARKSPFYADRLAVYNSWAEFPLIDKKVFMAEFNRINTRGIDREEAFALANRAEAQRDFSPVIRGVTVGLSTGTSGNRGIFLASTKERAQWVAAVLLKVLKPWRWKGQVKVAFFLRANSNLYRAVDSRKVAFQFFDLMEPVDDLLRDLQAFQPKVIVAQPSMLRIIAKAVEREELLITPMQVISVAEVLDPETNRLLERIFRQSIAQVYQCTEGFLACTCEEGTLHVNEDFVNIQPQYLDEAKTRYQPIVTDFTRSTQPVIRYLLNDVLVARSTPCPCGSPFLAIDSIEGRTDDVFYLAAIAGDARPVFADFIRKVMVQSSVQIEEYRVVQIAPSQLEISLQLSEGADMVVVKKAVTEAFEAFCASWQLLPLTLHLAEGIPYEAGVKRRAIRRSFSPLSTP